MNELFLIAGAAIAAYLFANRKGGGNSSGDISFNPGGDNQGNNGGDDQTDYIPVVAPIVEPFVMRNDDCGAGNYGASRGNRAHDGIDLVVMPGQSVFAPFDAIVNRYVQVYIDSTEWVGLELIGLGLYEGIRAKIFYITSDLPPQTMVSAGQIIGYAQEISKRYPDCGGNGMIDHVHIELRDQNGNNFDPWPFFTGEV